MKRIDWNGYLQLNKNDFISIVYTLAVNVFNAKKVSTLHEQKKSG